MDLGGLRLGLGVEVWTKWERIKGQLGIRSIQATAGSGIILLPIVTKSEVNEN